MTAEYDAALECAKVSMGDSSRLSDFDPEAEAGNFIVRVSGKTSWTWWVTQWTN